MFTKIISTGSYLPNHIRSNYDLEKMVNTSNEWIITRTGIHERRISKYYENVSFMGYYAAKYAIDNLKINIQDIGMIIVATTSSDYAFPSSACQIQKKLGINDSISFDLSSACTGFIYALSIADKYIKNKIIKYALVIGSDRLSYNLNPKDRGTLILFGDGAGAVILKSSKKPGILSTHIHANGKHGNLLTMPNCLNIFNKNKYIFMLGNEIFKIAVNILTNLINETINANNININKIDWFIPHQANLRIISAIIKKLRININKVIIILDKYGNTSSASIPIALDEAVRDNRIKKNQIILLEAFGGGLTWGSILLKF
ncbi:beta-ketoacyl-ACP synthase III [Sodalis-like secondary symbiont of Drepanosiphum platanoidis]|uniref:beta-ketoacyl-ACP synthase III n=1 Tax=Sodalis-like secondary symbiont of Drepanosiphum platanoidis TaxID=2994493 RepID=UPI0034642C9B